MTQVPYDFMWSGLIGATADLGYLFSWPHVNRSKLN